MREESLLGYLSELFFPSWCLLCSQPAESRMPLCPHCLGRLEWIGNHCCELCGRAFEPSTLSHLCEECRKKPPAYERARAVVKFEEPAIEIIHRFKYHRQFNFLKWMVKEMAGVYQKELADLEFELVIPIPLHWKRLIRRGYNQSQLLARLLAKKLTLGLSPSVLVRVKNTTAQVGLSQKQREINLKNAFWVKNPALVKGKRILLIDDVITSGATINEASKSLKRAGAELVGALAFARA